MKKNNHIYQTIECYITILIISTVFFGIIFLAGHFSGANEIFNQLPEFSWDMFNTWSEIKNKSN
ncbi:hypothetical protein ACFOZ1_02635 [Gracilibacillus marinus]|uniref:DNA-directed RNA polymerase subunit beta n=1 Tax=Gracilibacillus marinus TaxID=630535 RepID=A0ABV8VV75_9BACI